MALTYSEAVASLRHALKFGINPSLGPITKMCEALDDPQKAFRCIQVAGTNGKSSTVRIIGELLREKGFGVGIYTSPHLEKYPERIEVDGKVVSDRLFAEGIEAAIGAGRQAGVEPTEFELLTAAALWVFAHERVDWAVLECGLGGRWDATTVVTPEVAVITSIGLEHTKILGDTVEKIAAEKAAIVKPGVPCVVGHGIAGMGSIERQARESGSTVTVADPLLAQKHQDAMEHLPGYQNLNAPTAITAVETALGSRLPEELVDAALEHVAVPGRFEILRKDPLLVVDAAHNPQSAEVLAREVSRRFVCATAPASIAERQLAAGRPRVPALLLGVLADKDVHGVVRAIVPLFERVVATASRSPRSISARQLGRIVREETGSEPEVVETIPEALGLLEGTPVLATGSITVAGEVKRFWC